MCLYKKVKTSFFLFFSRWADVKHFVLFGLYNCFLLLAPGSRSPASTPLVQSGEDSEYAEVNPIDLKTAAQDDDIHVYSNIEVNQQNPRGVQRYVPHKKGPTPGVSNQPPGGSDHKDPSDVEMQTSGKLSAHLSYKIKAQAAPIYGCVRLASLGRPRSAPGTFE